MSEQELRHEIEALDQDRDDLETRLQDLNDELEYVIEERG